MLFEDDSLPAVIKPTREVLERLEFIEPSFFQLEPEAAYPWHLVPLDEYADRTIRSLSMMYVVLARYFLTEVNTWEEFKESLTADTVCDFIYWMNEEQNYAYNTVNQYVIWLRKLLYWDGVQDDFIWYTASKSLRRIRRTRTRSDKQAEPFQRKDLLDLLLHDDATPLMRIACSMQYDTLFRGDSLLRLNWQDLKVERDDEGRITEGTIVCRKGKTDQFAEGEVAWLSRTTCLLLDRLHVIQGAPIAGDIFQGTNYWKLYSMWKDVSKLLGKEGREWSAHSARVGAAIDMLESDIPVAQIALAGHWKGERMIMRYGRNALAKNNGMARMQKRWEEMETDMLESIRTQKLVGM